MTPAVRIAVNTLSIMPGAIGGGERYLVQLLTAMFDVDRENEYLLLVNDHNRDMFPDAPNVTKIRRRASKKYRAGRIVWEQIGLPFEVRRLGIGVLFSPANIAPILKLSCASVLTIHDLNWLSISWTQRGINGSAQSFLLSQSAKTADRIITVSATTRMNVMSRLGIDSDRIAVVHEGVDTPFWSAGRHDAPRERVILAVATSHPHKNLDGLVKAFSIMRRAERFADWKLKIAGMPGRAHAELLALIAELGLSDHVIMAGRVSDDELRDLYATSAVFVLPSKNEGFGLPLLEAMACGIPVVSSRSGSLREIGGDAALYVNPFDPEDIASRIAKVLDQPALRNTLVENGNRRIREFEWSSTARKTVDVLVDAAVQRRVPALQPA